MKEQERVWSVFASTLGREQRTTRVMEALAQVIDRAVAAWPEIELDRERFVRQLIPKLAKSEQEQELIAALDALHAEDLYLAHAAALGHPRALSELRTRLLPGAIAAVRRIDPTRAFADQVLSRLLAKLCVATQQEAPKIGSYLGRGPLAAWLRVAAVREGRNLLRDERRHAARAGDEGLDQLRARQADPELEQLRRQGVAEFRDAFRNTLATLEIDLRNVVRLYYLDGMTVEAIGKLYRVRASTISRWLARARRQILLETRRALLARLKLDPVELDSLLRAIDSDLEVSIAAALGPNERG